MMSKATLCRPASVLGLTLALLVPRLSNAQYCVPTCSTSCTIGGGDYIQAFATTGGSTNISNINSGCNGNTNNYIYYQALTVTAQPGNTLTWAMANCPNNSEYYGIWADWNQNGIFDATENIYTSPGAISPGATFSGTFQVPLTAITGNTRLRVRCWFSNSTSPGACGTMFYGETEDYNINITGGSTGCTSPPVAGTVSSYPNVICLSAPALLYVSGYTTGTTLQWQHSPSGTVWTNVNGAYGSNLQLTPPVTTGWYRVLVTCSGTTFSATTTPVQIAVSPNAPCQDSVWPGDANYDHIVSNTDALAIAVANNHVGSPRAGASISYTAQYANNWSTAFSNGVNHKNADCNGDSIVNTADLAAVTANYGLTHPRASILNLAKITGLPDLYVDLSGINLIPGVLVTAPIRFGTASSQVPKIYGIAATVQVQGLALSTPPVLAFTPTWIGAPANTLSFTKATSSNSTDWAVSRINQTNTSGNGILGTVSFQLPASASGSVTLHLQDVTLIDSAGALLSGYNVLDQTGMIVSTGVSMPGRLALNASIVPNPSSGNAALLLNLDQGMDLELKVMDMEGRIVWNQKFHAAAGNSSVSLPNNTLAHGIYQVHLSSPSGSSQVLPWVRR